MKCPQCTLEKRTSTVIETTDQHPVPAVYVPHAWDEHGNPVPRKKPPRWYRCSNGHEWKQE